MAQMRHAHRGMNFRLREGLEERRLRAGRFGLWIGDFRIEERILEYGERGEERRCVRLPNFRLGRV